MDFFKFKKNIKQKLDLLGEELIKSVTIPENPRSYSGLYGNYTIKPFGKYNSYVEVLFDCKDKYESFLNKFSSKDIILSDISFFEDNVIGLYKLSAFVETPLVDDLEIELRDILNKFKESTTNVETLKNRILKKEE